jgi:hypothetical protein
VALRSVVLAPPPGTGPPRRTVVLRPGAPKDKGRMADALAALFGALLLILAVVLVALLPDKEYATTQFRITYPDTLDDFTFATQRFNFTENDEDLRVHDFTYELPDNVASVNIRAEFTDEQVYTDPDQFRIELFDPSGNPMGTRYDAINKPPTPDTANPGEFVADSYSQTFNIATAEHPAEEIVNGLTHTETREQVLARIVPQHVADTAGTWTVRVTLVQANDCPAPGTGIDIFQFSRCYADTGDGTDPGNDFALAGFIYTFYTPCIEELGKSEGAPLCATG